MIKTILVPATGSDADAACFVTALSVARSFAAHIDALHVRLDPIEIAVLDVHRGIGRGAARRHHRRPDARRRRA